MEFERHVHMDGDGLVGTVVTCDPVARRPGVVVLGGSEGGLSTAIAERLSGEGFATLALAYFGVKGLPRRLVEVPVDYVVSAVEWFREHRWVDGSVGVLGGSKGAELALIAAAALGDVVGAVVAYAPSSVVFAGIDVAGDGRRRSSWSYQGGPMDFVPYPPRVWPSLSLRGVSVAPMYEAALRSPAAERAAINVEDIAAPVLLVSGDRDRMWPSSEMALRVVERMGRAGMSDRVTHLRYPDAGHRLEPREPGQKPGLGDFVFDFGGSADADRDAAADAWPKVVSFLKDALARSDQT